jgi:hypothetical protein
MKRWCFCRARTSLSLSLLMVALWLTMGCGGGGRSSLIPSPSNPSGPSGFLFSVQSTPPGAEILLNGRSTGFRTVLLGSEPFPLPTPPVGTHLLTLKAQGFHDWHQWIDWTGDGSVIVKATMTVADQPPGTLTVTSDPPGARLLVDGEDTGKTTPATLSLPPSRHAIALTLDGYLTARDIVDIPSGGSVSVHLPLTRQERGMLTGTVYDRFGNAPVGATVQLRDEQGNLLATTRTTAFGAFWFANLAPATYTLTAEIVLEGVREIAFSEPFTISAGQRTHATLVLFPADLLGDVEGVVQTPDGRPIPDAQVAVLYYAAGLDFVLTSRRTRTDSQGRFLFVGLPAAQQVLIARKVGYQSVQTQVTPKRGERVSTTITLSPLGSNTSSVNPPTQVFAIAETLPTGEGNRLAMPRHLSPPQFYRQFLLRQLQRHQHPLARRLRTTNFPSRIPPSRFFPLGFIGQVEVGWQPHSTRPSESLLGYHIYRSVPTASGWQLRMVVDEPEQTVVADIGYDLTAGQTYRYAVSAVTLSGQETAKSEPAETTVLPPLRLVSPDNGAAVPQSQLVFRWQPIGGKVPFFVVQVYSDPEALLSSDPVWDSDVLADVNEATYSGQRLLNGKTYFWVVIGLDDRDWHTANAFTVSEVRQVVIAGD